MNNYIGLICEKYGTNIYYDLINETLEFQKINTVIVTNLGGLI